MKKYAVILFLMFSCNSITMVDVTKENLSVGINGLVSDIVLWRGGAVTLTIYKDGKFEDVGVGKKFYELIKKGDYFTFWGIRFSDNSSDRFSGWLSINRPFLSLWTKTLF